MTTYCRICEAHCGLIVELNENGGTSKLSPDRNHPISQGFICAKGLKFLDVADHPHRLLKPLLKTDDGNHQEATWDDALEHFAHTIRPIIGKHGPHAVAFYMGTPMIHNALGALTLFRFMRAIGTRNYFSAGSQDNSNKFCAQKIVHGSEWRMPIFDLLNADFALVIGSNPVVSQGTFIHMPGGTKTYDTFIERGGKMVIVDPRFTESATRWGGHVPIRPATDVYLLLAILHDLRDLQRTEMPEGLSRLLEVAAHYPAEIASELTDIPTEKIKEISGNIREAERATFCLSVGVNQGPFGTLCMIIMQAIAYLTSNFDAEGGLLFSSKADILGLLLGLKSFRSRIGDYKLGAPGLPCGILGDEILTPGEGQIRALIVVCGNPLTSAPDENKLHKAFEQLDLLVSIDIFKNETAQMADIILPGTTWLERFDVAAWDAMYETEPFLQMTSPVRQPPGETRTEREILADLSIAADKPILGSRWLANRWARMDWDHILPRLLNILQYPIRKRFNGAGGLFWWRPRPGVYDGRRRIKLRFWSEELEPEVLRLEQFVDKSAVEYHEETFVLISRRRRLAQNSWVHNAGRDETSKEAVAWLHPDDMIKHGLEKGNTIILTSNVGRIEIDVAPSETLQPGMICVPHGLPGININALISSDSEYIEPVSGMHRLSGHHVQLEKKA